MVDTADAFGATVGGASEFKILVWNAQDWAPAQTLTNSQKLKQTALVNLLLCCRPDLVVLLETGRALQDLETDTGVGVYLKNDKLMGKYCEPKAVERDAFSSDADKGIVWFCDKKMKVSVITPPLAYKERRPFVFLTLDVPYASFKKGECFGFTHSIANSKAADAQLNDIRSYTPCLNQCFLIAGDFNSESDPPSWCEKDGFAFIEQKRATHKNGNVLDRALIRTDSPGNWKVEVLVEVRREDGRTSHRPTRPGSSADLVRIMRTPEKDGASDHAAMLYTYTYK